MVRLPYQRRWERFGPDLYNNKWLRAYLDLLCALNRYNAWWFQRKLLSAQELQPRKERHLSLYNEQREQRDGGRHQSPASQHSATKSRHSFPFCPAPSLRPDDWHSRARREEYWLAQDNLRQHHPNARGPYSQLRPARYYPPLRSARILADCAKDKQLCPILLISQSNLWDLPSHLWEQLLAHWVSKVCFSARIVCIQQPSWILNLLRPYHPNLGDTIRPLRELQEVSAQD